MFTASQGNVILQVLLGWFHLIDYSLAIFFWIENEKKNEKFYLQCS